MKRPPFPTPEEIEATIEKVEAKFHQDKEGFGYCLKLLNHRLENPENPYFIAETKEEWDQLEPIYRNQLKDIPKLKELESRTVAVLCVNWLNGDKNALNFLNQLTNR